MKTYVYMHLCKKLKFLWNRGHAKPSCLGNSSSCLGVDDLVSNSRRSPFLLHLREGSPNFSGGEVRRVGMLTNDLRGGARKGIEAALATLYDAPPCLFSTDKRFPVLSVGVSSMQSVQWGGGTALDDTDRVVDWPRQAPTHGAVDRRSGESFCYIVDILLGLNRIDKEKW